MPFVDNNSGQDLVEEELQAILAGSLRAGPPLRCALSPGSHRQHAGPHRPGKRQAAASSVIAGKRALRALISRLTEHERDIYEASFMAGYAVRNAEVVQLGDEADRLYRAAFTTATAAAEKDTAASSRPRPKRMGLRA